MLIRKRSVYLVYFSNLRFLSLRLLIAVFAFSGCATSPTVNYSGRTNQAQFNGVPTVVLISIDGYRSDYTDLYKPPALTQFREEGRSASGLIPVYPSKTFTNHLSIVTGLYAENHGIVANTFFDPTRNQRYQLSDRAAVADGTWYKGTPLWIEAEKQGELAANMFWPASEAEIEGMRASYYVRYDESISKEMRVQQVVKWLKLPEEKRPHFITLYFSDVDTAGHKFGPASEEVKKAVLDVDRAISQFLEKVRDVGIPVDIFIVSDHGMQELDLDKVEYLSDFTDLKDVRTEGSGPQVLLYTQSEKKTESLYKDLKSKAKHFKVFKRKQMPESYHYSKNNRCGDLILMAEAPYSMRIQRQPKAKDSDRGNHGYDPDTTPSMLGIFYAKGPHVRTGKTLAPFRNIHIYPLLSKILGLKSTHSIDGRVDVLEDIYQEEQVH